MYPAPKLNPITLEAYHELNEWMIFTLICTAVSGAENTE
jgi:hypothetical protein